MFETAGLHHLTAITADAQANYDFYVGLLGLRLVKKTVNFDDPTSYHLYYGDAVGSVGSTVTFFVIPGLVRGRVGAPMIDGVSLVLPADHHAAAVERLRAAGLPVDPMPEGGIYTTDPDGQQVSLQIGEAATPHVRLGELAMLVRHVQQSREFVSRWLGESALCWLDIDAHGERGRNGAGTIHHVAFRAPDEQTHQALHERLTLAGVNVSPIMDRHYFKSIYFREPAGVLVEVATDGPGFAVDEPVESLGQKLCLPTQYEPHRREIESMLPKLQTE